MPTQSKIGAFVLETLTTGMYTNPLDALREYIQNATDSILAIDHNVLSTNEGKITVIIDKINRKIKIHDNGQGVKNVETQECLVDVGMSKKVFGKGAGFRGIGRLAGIAYCGNLIFRTKTFDEELITTTRFNCEGIIKDIQPRNLHAEEFASVINKNCEITTEVSAGNNHFFEVVMEDVNLNKGGVYLDCEKVENYLIMNSPVDFDSQKFIYAPKINEYAKKNQKMLNSVRLILKSDKGEREIFKPYKNNYKTKGKEKEGLPLRIKDVDFFPKELNANSSFWIWYGVTDLLGTIDDERAAGLKFRSKNIAIGSSDRVAELFGDSNKRFNNWLIGEIHIISNNIVPNGRRDGFEEDAEWLSIKEAISPFIAERINEIRITSQARNLPVIKIQEKTKKIIDELDHKLNTGFVSLDQKNKTLQKLDDEVERIEKALKGKRDMFDVEKLNGCKKELIEKKKEIQEESVYISRKLNTSLDKRQRKIIGEILLILNSALDKENYKKAEKAILEKYK